MSGLAGLVHRDGRPVERHDMERLARALPQFDGARATLWNGGSAGFVHRLYAITPEDRFERQPWASRDGSWRLVFAGRLDDREALAAQLGLPLPDLREMADGALCLAAIERWGEEAPAHLFGAFAFACWNERDRRLLLCRDPTGVRSLYLHRGLHFIAFATAINTLHALPEVPHALDETAVGDLLANNPLRRPHRLPRHRTRPPRRDRSLRGRRRDHAALLAAAAPHARLKSHEDCVEAARRIRPRRGAHAAQHRAVRRIGQRRPRIERCWSRRGASVGTQPLAAYSRLPPPGFDSPETDGQYFSERSKVSALADMHPNMDVTFIDDATLHVFDREPFRAIAATRLRSSPRTTSAGSRNSTIGWGRTVIASCSLANSEIFRSAGTDEICSTNWWRAAIGCRRLAKSSPCGASRASRSGELAQLYPRPARASMVARCKTAVARNWGRPGAQRLPRACIRRRTLPGGTHSRDGRME